MTLFDALASALEAARAYNRIDLVAPVAVLWTDRDELWRPLLPRLRERFPVLTYGPYDPQERTGPAIWLRCMLSRALPEADWDPYEVPVLYLPGVSRADFRAVETCPEPLQPLLELQYRGVLWSQKNGKDWTIASFLQSNDCGIVVPVAGDEATREALKRWLALLADESIDELRRAAPLKADYLNGIGIPDLTRTLLHWMNDPAGQRAEISSSEWAAFCESCQNRFGFHPEEDGPVTAAALLGERDCAWEQVWSRFAEGPSRFPGVPELLRRARPDRPKDLFDHASRASWPQDNEEEEADLRKRLMVMDGGPAQAYSAVRAAEELHGGRRGWVWSALGQAPLAGVLPRLNHLAEVSQTPLSGSTPDELANAYAEVGWEADAAALDALAGVESAADVAAVRQAVQALYRPWLEDLAVRFQKLVEEQSSPSVIQPMSKKPGRCILFADALRYDVAHRLADHLRSSRFDVELGWRFSVLPSVTPTAKPAVSPVAHRLGPGRELAPSTDGNAPVNITSLRKLLSEEGVQVLQGDEIGVPEGTAWTEAGHLDSTGHSEGWRLAKRIEGEVRSIAERVSLLLEGGWEEVRVVTDHGWLLLPGGLPKAELPEHLTDVRKGRCARLKPDAQTSHMVVPWHWDPMARIALAPGISCYTAGKEYEHGGLSLQECVLPVMTVRRAGGTVTLPQVKIETLKWTGLRCAVTVSGESAGAVLDLRTKPVDPASSVLVSPKPFSAEGKASVAVPDDTLEGSAVVAVVLHPSGEVLVQKSTIIGE